MSATGTSASVTPVLDKYVPHLTAGEDDRSTTDEELARTAEKTGA